MQLLLFQLHDFKISGLAGAHIWLTLNLSLFLFLNLSRSFTVSLSLSLADISLCTGARGAVECGSIIKQAGVERKRERPSVCEEINTMSMC